MNNMTPPPLPKRAIRKKKRRIRPLALLLILLTVFAFGQMASCLISLSHNEGSQQSFTYEEPFSKAYPEIYEKIVNTAREYDIEDHVDELVAIVMVESGGQVEDVFQSSESLGLLPNSLNQDESIQQGVAFYAKLLNSKAEKGVDQDSVYQAYNFGRGFLDYIVENGGVYSFELAEAYSKEMAKGEQVPYNNPIALEYNGGYRYNYGNMFYVSLIHQALEKEAQLEMESN